jgi:D-erythronate 2-dehydrogenase
MNVLVTGGSGFIGQAIIIKMLQAGSVKLDGRAHPITSITSFDQAAGAYLDTRIRYVIGDLASSATVHSLVTDQTKVVIHLAAVVSGTAEANFDLGMHVNVDGTRHLLEACRLHKQVPRFLFSSSLAVFGGPLPSPVRDDTTPTPQGSYGIQKYIGEQLVQDFTRKGYVDGRSVRLPTVTVRPGKPNGAASSFASGVVREPLAGVPAVLPVAPATRMWVVSPRAVVNMLLHAIDLPGEQWGWFRAINLPGLTISMTEVLAELAAQAGSKARALVTEKLQPEIVKLVDTWPASFDCARGLKLGFEPDKNFGDILRQYREDNPGAVKLP